MRIRKRHTIVHALSDFRQLWGQLFLLGVATRLTATVLMLPVAAVVLRMAAASRGETTLSDAEIVGILLQPPGIIVLALLGVVWMGVAFLEQAGLMTVGYAAIEGRRVSWLSALRYVASKLVSVLHLGGHLLIRILLIAAPFLIAAALVIRFFLGDQDIYHHLYHRNTGTLLAAIFLLALLLTMLFLLAYKVVSWLLAIPAILFEDLGPLAAIVDSVEDSKHHRWQLAGLLTLWVLLGLLAAVLGTFALGWLARLTVRLGGVDEAARLAFILGATGVAALLLYALIAFVASALFALSAVRVYRDCSGPGQLPPVEGETPLRDPVDERIPGKRLLVGTIAGMALSVVLALTITSILRNPADEALVIGHRGASAVAPENTEGAVRAAEDSGADFAEFDVLVTADDPPRIIVFHDVAVDVEDDGDDRFAHFNYDGIKVRENADGSFNVVKKGKTEPLKPAGQWLWLRDAKLADLQKINVGKYLVEKEGFARKYENETIPTLERILGICRSTGMKAMIELKYFQEPGSPKLGEEVINIVERMNMRNDVVVMSFDREGVAEMKKKRPAWTYGQLFNFQPKGDLTDLDVSFVGVQKRGARPWFFVKTKRAGLGLYVFTVDDPFEISAMISRGADGIITNNPALARTVLDLRADLGPLERLLVAVGAEVGTFSILD